MPLASVGMVVVWFACWTSDPKVGSLRSRHRGEGNWGERERTPEIKTPFCLFLRPLVAAKFQLANLCWVVNIVNSHGKSAMRKSVCQFLIGEHVNS